MFRENLFWLCSLLILLTGFTILLFFPGANATVWANNHNTLFLDHFFSLNTKVAEGPVVVLAIGWAFYIDWKTGLWASICYGIEALSVSMIKLTVAAIPGIAVYSKRPIVEMTSALHPINGVEIYSYHSFPSGHTAAAFIGFGIISVFTKNKYLQCLCAIMATLVAYSRLYLGEHYLRDVLAGGVIALVVLYLFTKALPKLQSLQLRKK